MTQQAPRTKALEDSDLFTEECLHIPCADSTLIGVLARPQQPSGLGLLVIVGGPQYRVGSHRQFVLLARTLAKRGHAVLRFDYSGMGDSDGKLQGFLNVASDIDEALSSFRRAMPALQHIALWGLCDGASAALLYLDARPSTPVSGLCLLNPWVRSPQVHAAAQVKHYYAGRLTDASFWRKLLRGQVSLGRLTELMRHVRAMVPWLNGPDGGNQAGLAFQKRMARSWHQSDQPILLILSGRDLVAKEFLEAVATSSAWHRALVRPRLTRVDLPDADHTFTRPGSSEAVEQATAEWLEQMAGAPVIIANSLRQPR